MKITKMWILVSPEISMSSSLSYVIKLSNLFFPSQLAHSFMHLTESGNWCHANVLMIEKKEKECLHTNLEKEKKSVQNGFEPLMWNIPLSQIVSLLGCLFFKRKCSFLLIQAPIYFWNEVLVRGSPNKYQLQQISFSLSPLLLQYHPRATFTLLLFSTFLLVIQ